MCQLSDGTAGNVESLLSDPLIQLVMASDGVTADELRAVLETARAAICKRVTDEPRRITLVP
jgi:hypothetical protein